MAGGVFVGDVAVAADMRCKKAFRAEKLEKENLVSSLISATPWKKLIAYYEIKATEFFLGDFFMRGSIDI